MRKMLISIAVPALVATAFPAAAAQGNAQQPRARGDAAAAQRAEDQSAGERRICVTERLSGSRMPRRVCRTEAEWQALQGGEDERN